MSISRNKVFRRRGLALAELIVATGVAVVMLAGVAQLMHQAMRQYQRAANRNLVALEAANLMEDLMSRDWGELSPDAPPEVELSAACRQANRDARLNVEIAGEENDAVRRLTVIIDWQGERRAEPYRLVAWRYQQSRSEGQSP
jgi:Tfp pilus assembly protein PilV